MKYKVCEGEGQGSCTRCEDKGKWNRHWMCFLFEIEGKDGCYCQNCLNELREEESYEATNRKNKSN